MQKKIHAALISVYYKDGLEPIVRALHQHGVILYSTGGTQTFIEALGIPVVAVESLTGFPEILGGRVKTLQPKIFGGILARRENPNDMAQLEAHQIPLIDLVIVDLYPFEETLRAGGTEAEMIEKIDIGGISLIRATAKNFNDTLIVSSRNQYEAVLHLLEKNNCSSSLAERKEFAIAAFATSSHYDTAIYKYLAAGDELFFRQSFNESQVLRYGENPHQKAVFFGKLNDVFDKLHGKELSYNNLVDIDAAVNLIREFKETAFVIIKHTNACGIAIGNDVKDAYLKALACDSTSAFGGILICNRKIDLVAAEEIHQLFCEVLIAPDFEEAALELLQSKKNRVLLKIKMESVASTQFKSLLNGVLYQDVDNKSEKAIEFKQATEKFPTNTEVEDLEFAVIASKHLKSNTIAIVKNKQLIGMGCGQTSRVDALRQAIQKATEFGFDLHGAVMASDAFFPFPDCVEIAFNAGLTAVAQPGGSIKDQESIHYCNKVGMAMVLTGVRHFKH
jgi:phosphoribosylaminoimidazolecarboxamide formyltransferase/IMP cyclohydrolase